VTCSSLEVVVADPSDVAAARRAALDCASSLQFSGIAAAKAALVATELATNLIKHGGGGSIVINSDDETSDTLELLAIDKGSGIASLPAALRDGYSTAGSAGTGLGAIQRQSSFFDVYSHPATGTVVLSRVTDDERTPRTANVSRDVTLRIAGICVPMRGQTVSGDAWSATRDHQRVTIVIADGLGHGESAAQASSRAIGIFRERERDSLEEVLHDMHGPLRATRGAAVSVARIHLAARKAEFAGVGNVAGAFVDENTTRRAVSHAGTVGAEIRRVQLFTYPWTASSILIMHSDGLSASWSMETYPGLQQRSPAVIAGVLFRDFCRGRDDATIVVAKA
jgi:anti-sigma regulatory factor (Ser/Thr protein kinase)